MTKRKYAKNKRPRASRKQIVESLILYMNDVENGPEDRKWWAQQTGWKISDLNRWLDPRRHLSTYARDIIANRYDLVDLPTGRTNDPVDLEKVRARRRGAPVDIPDAATREQQSERNIALAGGRGVATNGSGEPVSDDHAAINRQMDEIKNLRALLKEKDATIETLIEEVDNKAMKTDRLHRYLGMMTENEIERAEKAKRA